MERKNKESIKDQRISLQRSTSLKHALVTMTIVSSLLYLLLGTLPSHARAGSMFHYILINITKSNAHNQRLAKYLS